MPFVISRVNVGLSAAKEAQLAQRLGAAIAHMPGKSERGLMLGFEDNCRLWLAGRNDAPMVYVEADVFANEGHVGCDAFSAEMAQAFHDVLGIHPDRVYVRYADIPVWSVGQTIVDRCMFG